MATQRLSTLLLALQLLATTGCLGVGIGRATPEPAAPHVSLTATAGNRAETAIGFRNGTCDQPATFVLSTDSLWIELPPPAEIRGLAPGASAQLPLVLDLTRIAPGERRATLRVRCPNCPARCVHPDEVVLSVTVAPPEPPSIRLTLGLFHRLATTSRLDPLVDAPSDEIFARLTEVVPGFQQYLRGLRRAAGVVPRFRFVAPGRSTDVPDLWPQSFPATTPPMLLLSPDLWTLVTFEPVTEIRPASLFQATATPPPIPPLLHYLVAPERWEPYARIDHRLCAEPATLRWAIVSLTYGGGTVDRLPRRIDPDRWEPCPEGSGASASARAYALGQPTRSAAPSRLVVAAGYFVDRQTRAGPVLAVPLPVR